MKTIFCSLSTVLLLSFAIGLSSCKDDETPVFAVEDLYGTWKSESGDEDDCYTLYEISETEIVQMEDCGDGAQESGSYEYTYENNTITFDTILGEVQLKVTSLSDTKVKWKYYWVGQSLGSETFVKQ